MTLLKVKSKKLLLCILLISSGSALVAQDSLLINYKQAQNKGKTNKTCEYAWQLARKFAMKGHADSAIFYGNKAFETAIIISDSIIQINAANIIGLKSLQKGDNTQALKWFNQAIEIATQKKDTLLLANVLLNKSMIYSSVGSCDYPKALELLIQAAKLNEEAKVWSSLPSNYKSISIICKEIGDSIGRESYLKKALKLIDDGLVANLSTKAIVFNEVGRYYTDENPDYNKANMYYDKVLDICRKIGWEKGVSVSLTNKAEIMVLQKKYNEALQLHKQVLELKQQANDVYGITNSHSLIGELLIKQKKYPEALSHLNKAKALAEQSQKTNILKKIHLSLYKVYRELGKYKLSLENHEKFSFLTDSINNIQHTKIIEELKTKYETDKKEQLIKDLTLKQEIAKLQADKKLQNFVIVISLLITIIGAILLITRQNNIKSKEQESQLNQKLLRTQMNPHFIFNSLNSINTYIIGNKATEAGLFLSKFAKLMRSILESSRNELINLEQEITTIKYYLELEKLRFNNNFSFEISCDKNIDQQEIELPPMLIQPFVENAIKHGIKQCNGTGLINVDFKMPNDNTLVCLVSDNGIGISNSENNKSHTSHAIDITRERLSILNKKSNLPITLNFIDKHKIGGQGTSIELSIPV